ncbi:FAD binding domain-containing protein [bacterium]|nr:FAD binding domain-containing protein [bacterium]
MKAFDYAIAENPAGAIVAMGKGYKVKANGIDLLDRLKERTEEHDKFVTIHEIKELSGISEADGMIQVGATTTLREIGASTLIQSKFPALAKAAADAATPQVRAKATLGGNLCQRPRCWYFRDKEYHCLKKGGYQCFAVEGDNRYHAIFSDGPCHIVHPSNTAPSLVAAGAEIVVLNKSGERIIPAGEFFALPLDRMRSENVLADGDLITAVRIKPPAKSAYVEFREKQSFDWPIASCAVVNDGKRWNVVLGAVAPIPWRSEAAEGILEGKASIDAELADKAAAAALQEAKPMSDNAWRMKVAKTAVRRALLAADGKEAV